MSVVLELMFYISCCVCMCIACEWFHAVIWWLGTDVHCTDWLNTYKTQHLKSLADKNGDRKKFYFSNFHRTPAVQLKHAFWLYWKTLYHPLIYRNFTAIWDYSVKAIPWYKSLTTAMWERKHWIKRGSYYNWVIQFIALHCIVICHITL